MSDTDEIKHYSPQEESLNILSHSIGLVLSVIALVLLLTRAASKGTALEIISAGIFGASLIALYGASTVYHRATVPSVRARLRVLDHATIYLLIAGTYTPFTLITLNGVVGWTIFSVSWGMAITGIALKLFFTGRFSLLSTLMYVFMGWIIIFAIKPLIDSLSTAGLIWLGVGGLSYTVGAIVYSIKKIPFNHATFHLFVLAGSFCHFISVYYYVLN